MSDDSYLTDAEHRARRASRLLGDCAVRLPVNAKEIFPTPNLWPVLDAAGELIGYGATEAQAKRIAEALS